MNALNFQVMDDFIKHVVSLDNDPELACIVITGNDKAFAAGADIKEMIDKTAAEMREALYFADWNLFANMKTPKVAAVNGYALGGGCELAMMCDFIIAGESAQFGQPEIKLGVIPGIGGTQRMTKLIGRAKSMDMHLTGRMMGAVEALSSGLITRIFPDDKLVDEAMKIAAIIAKYSKPALSMAVDAVHKGDNFSLEQGLVYERDLFYSLFDTDDQKEGMAAFIEKRKPAFKGS
jgi:enoyl-CoA hydratase|tara:strand:+ start:4117 stop:4818 length:702 start_codon:yes stop_codon:yes gene_type:complete